MQRLQKNNIHTVNLLAVCLAFQLCYFKNSALVYMTFGDIITELGISGKSVWFALILSFLRVCITAFVFYLPLRLIMRNKSGGYPLSVKRELPLYPFYIIFFCVSVCLMTVISLDCINGVIPGLFKVSYNLPDGALALALYFAVSVVFVSAFNEIFFRGIVLPVLLPWGRTFAIFASALTGAALALDFRQFVLYAVIGLMSGYFVSHTGSLWMGVFISLCANTTVFLHDFILAEGIYAAYPVFFRVSVAVIFALGIYCCLKMDDQLTDSRVVPIRANESERRLADCLMAPCAVAYYIIVIASL
ncbi:MAG: CPBP family intramembrane metalloprotease [Clostridia bacterium]|nr:CPBP family intramembrane metalloprotease [Clostridia bacterium]